MTDLREEFDYYLGHQADFVSQYNGKVIVLKACRVIGVFHDEATAVAETAKTHEKGTFLVQRVAPGASATSQTFHSRVAFG